MTSPSPEEEEPDPLLVLFQWKAAVVVGVFALLLVLRVAAWFIDQ